MDRRASYMSNTALPSFLATPSLSLTPPTLYSRSNGSASSLSSNESDLPFDIIAEFPLFSIACGMPIPPSAETAPPAVDSSHSLKPPPIPARSRSRPKPRPQSMMDPPKPFKYRESTDFTDLFTRRDHSRDSSFLSMSSEHSTETHQTQHHAPAVEQDHSHLQQPQSILRPSTSSPHLNAGFAASGKPRAKSPPKSLRFQDEHPPVTYQLASKKIPSLTVEPPSPPALFDLPSFVPFSSPPRKEAPVKRLWRTLASVGKRTQNTASDGF